MSYDEHLGSEISVVSPDESSSYRNWEQTTVKIPKPN